MSTLMQPWQPLSRNDRHVRRANLRLPAGFSEHRATLLVEEALRLMALPGEDQGRTYYFRRVLLQGMATAAPTSEWVDCAQSTMHALALRALHGGDARAADADAVFFNSQEEALEWLLRRITRAFPHQINETGWFARLIAPVGDRADATAQLVAVIERLRSLPAGWFAAAILLLDLMEGNAGALAVLESIPDRVVRMWLGELGSTSAKEGYYLRISDGRKRILRRCLTREDQLSSILRGSSASGVEVQSTVRHSVKQLSSHLVWVAALTAIAEDSGVLARGSAIATALAMLSDLAAPTDGRSEEDPRKPTASSSQAAEEVSPDALETGGRETLADAVLAGIKAPDEKELVATYALDASLFTAAGGLYFLLNVLRLLGIETAIEALPAPMRKTFLANLIRSLARTASVAGDDPAMQLVVDALGVDNPPEPFDGLIYAGECWPRTLLAAPERDVTPERLVRVWTLSVQRWCWLNARLTLREVVARPGRILLTRTDLDVTFSMDTVDLRVRRVGLDLDPGWLPWFGRVVRFHYVSNALHTGLDGGESA